MNLFGSATTFYLCCYLLLLFIISVQAYTPVDLFSISCGSSGNSSDNDRIWIGDINSKLVSPVVSQDKASVTAKALTQSSSTNQVPYTAARLSRYEFAYSFPVTNGQKFVRLFFYPTSYEQGFDRSKAFFTVKSGNFTVLKDFNASLTADADDNPGDTIFREYCINVDDGEKLNLTFTPSPAHPGSYAFINGIEIVSMPTDLYYTKPQDQDFKLVGSTVQYSITNSSALETEYRLIVGGNTLSPGQDTGMLRSWVSDNDYVTSPSALPVQYGDVNLNFTKIPDYTAPPLVYKTERSMGRNATQNRESNLAWELPVDTGFTYMLRLHFCELDPHINDYSNRQFNIYIADQLAEDRANVLRWSKGKGIPIYRDYAVIIAGNHKKATLSLKMSPPPDLTEVAYVDAFLNGLEIFKISDPQRNLAGPNPDPRPINPPTSDLTKQNSKTRNIGKLIGVVAGVVSGVLLLSIVVFFAMMRRGRTVKDTKSSDRTSKWAPFSFSTTKSTNKSGSSLPSDLCRHFSIAEMRAATNNFDELFIVGVGGFGHVYKGYIDDGTTPVAIKRLKPGSQQGAHEFKTEIEMLSQLRHLHLVSLIGYCNESNEMILVYDFMARGTLRHHLYNTDNPALSWKQRLQVCIGAARGLHYLHTGAKHMIIHRDVKSTNILLDEKWMAKVSDFGLSRIGPTGMSKAHVSTVVKGSVGYLDPEYYKRQRLTEKSDVYSFGVVLFEILCARPPLIRTAEKKQVSLADWARHCYQLGTLSQIVDPCLRGKIAPECLRKYGEIAVSCLVDDGSQRPSMNDVVWGLEFVLQLQENAEQREQQNGVGQNRVGGGGKEDNDDMFSSGTSVGQVSDVNQSSGISGTSSTGEESYAQKESDRLLSETAFSEIVDPRAR